MSELDLTFKSPFCDHTITATAIANNETVSCACGKTFKTDTIIEFLEQKAATDRAYFAFDAMRKRYDLLYEELERQSKAASATVGSGAKSVTAAIVDRAVALSQESLALAPTQPAAKPKQPAAPKPAKPVRPKRQPLAPRTVLLMVAALIAMVGVTVFMVTNRDSMVQALFVVVFVGATGFGAVKAHKSVRGLSNFLAAISTSVLGLALFYLGTLSQVGDNNFADPSTSLYLPAVVAALSGASLYLGHRFKIAGWAALAPIGLTIAAVMTTLGFFQQQGLVVWSTFVGSIFALAIGYTGAKAKLPIPEYESPTDTQLFEVSDARRERRFTKQMVNLGMIVALGLVTVAYIQIVTASVLSNGAVLLALIPTGLFWLATAFGLERIGGRFTDSGEVSALVIRGAWLSGFTNLAVAFVSIGTSNSGALQANYSGAFLASAVAALLLLTPKFVGPVRNSEYARQATTVAAFSAWGSWWATTPNFSLGTAEQARVFTTLLILVSLVWMLVRFVYNTNSHQFFAVVPGSLAAVLLPTLWGAAGADTAANQLAAQSAVVLVIASALIAVVEFGNSYLTRRSGGESSLRIAAAGIGANVLLVGSSWMQFAGSLPSAISTTGTTASGVTSLAGASILLAVSRLAYLGSRFSNFDAQLERTAKVASVTYLVYPFLAAVTWLINTGAAAEQIFALLLAVEFVIVLAFSALRSNHNFAVSALGLGFALAISLQVLILETPSMVSAAIPLGVLVFLGLQALTTAVISRRVPEANNIAVKSTPVLLGSFALTQLALSAGNTHWTSGRSWVASLTYLAVSIVAFQLAARVGSDKSERTGFIQSAWTMVAFSLVSSLITIGHSGTALHAAVILLAASVLIAAVGRRLEFRGAQTTVASGLRISLLLFTAYASEFLNFDDAVIGVLFGFGAILVWYLTDFAASRLGIGVTSRRYRFVTLSAFAILLWQRSGLGAIDGVNRDFYTSATTFAVVLTFVLTTVFALGRSVMRLRNASEESDANFGIWEPTVLWIFGFVNTVGMVWQAQSHLILLEGWIGLAGLIAGYHTLRTRWYVTAIASYVSVFASGLIASVWLVAKLRLPFGTPLPLSAAVAFGIGAWLIGRTEAGITKAFSLALPITSGIAYIIAFTPALSYLRTPATRLTESALNLAAVAAGFWLVNGKVGQSLSNLSYGLKLQVGVFWITGFILASWADGGVNLYLVGSAAIALWYGLRYGGRAAAYATFLASILGGLHYLSGFTGTAHLPTLLPALIVGMTAFALGAWILARKAPLELQRYSSMLPVSFLGLLVWGLVVYKVAPQFEAEIRNLAWVNLLDWSALFAIFVTGILLSSAKSNETLSALSNNIRNTAGISWLGGLILTIIQGDSLKNAQLTHLIYLVLTSLAAIWFANRFKSAFAVYAIYASGVGVAILGSLLLAATGPEPFAVITAAYALVGNYFFEREIKAFRGTLVKWGVPAGLVLVVPALYTVSYAMLPFAQQTQLQTARFIVVSVVATIGVLLGIRLGNRGITTASTTALMVALVPGLWFRIEDLTASATARNETKALLVAVTVYALTYIFRKNTEKSLPSLVIWGVPVVIALSLSFTDALSAVSHPLTAEDWIRFGVVMGAATAFLILGAIRRIAGMFYPGLIAVVATVLPYSWQVGGFFWIVLLLLASLIVWVAIRLDRFTGWLKALD